jgi:lipopolysaccharide export system protein LptA
VTWQQTARWGVAAVGIGCAVAIAAYSRRRPDPRPRPPVLQTLDPAAQFQGGAGQTFYYRKGRSNITVTFANTRAYEDGRAHFETVVIEGLEESRFTVRSAVMETSAPAAGGEQPRQLNLSGGVKLTTEDGLELLSDTAVWDEAASQLTMPGDVTFKKGRVSGTGTGATYDRAHDSFNLLAQARARVQPDADGHGQADLSSARMSLVRNQHIVQLDENARIVGETQTLSGRNATLSFTDDEQAMKYLELRGSARVTPNPATPRGPAAPSPRPAMEADNVTMSFYEDGVTLQHATLTGHSVLTLGGDAPRTVRGSWIDVTTASDGQTLTGLQAKDRVIVVIAPTATSAGRTITSSVLTAVGDAKKGLTSARFDGNPRFEETPAAAPRRGAPPPAQASRWGTAVVLVLKLGGQIDAIEQAEFQQNAKFHDGDVTGDADIAQYDEANGLLHLLQAAREPRKVSHVDTADMSVNALTIHVNTNTNDLDAQGSVVTRSTASATDTAKPGALFGGSEPIIGSAETLRFTKTTGAAVYTGTPRAQAQLKQGQSEITADRIDYSDTTRGLVGTGKVYSVWWLETTADTPGAKDKPLKSQRVRADTMTYDDATRIAVYKGAPVHVTTSDSDIEGRMVTFRLAETERALKSMRAEGGVWATLSGGSEAVCEVLVYDAAIDVYTLEGLLGQETAKVKSPRADSPPTKPMCDLYTGMRLQLNRKTGAVTVPGTGQAPRVTDEVACSTSLRRSK